MARRQPPALSILESLPGSEEPPARTRSGLSPRLAPGSARASPSRALQRQGTKESGGSRRTTPRQAPDEPSPSSARLRRQLTSTLQPLEEWYTRSEPVGRVARPARMALQALTPRSPAGMALQALTPRSPCRDPGPQVEVMREVCRIQRELSIPVQSMQAAMRLFREHATVALGGEALSDGELTKEGLAAIIRQMAGYANEAIEASMVEHAFILGDGDARGAISFYEFALWYSSHIFDEHFNLDARELELRKLARFIDMSPVEFDTYKRHFDSFDTDGSGTMDREEFYEMMLKCLKVPKHIGLPESRVQQLWTAADSDGSGVIDFAEFVVFFKRYFPQWGDGSPQGSKENAFQSYSQNNGLLNALYDC